MGKKEGKIVQVDMYHAYEEIDEMHASKSREITLTVPSNLRLLCAILDVKVEQLLTDYMWMLSYSYHKKASAKQRKLAVTFFQSCKYGGQLYSTKQIRQMFDELQCERKIFDTIDNMTHYEIRLFWKNHHMYMEYWYKRWFTKIDRAKGDLNVLNDY